MSAQVPAEFVDGQAQRQRQIFHADPVLELRHQGGKLGGQDVLLDESLLQPLDLFLGAVEIVFKFRDPLLLTRTCVRSLSINTTGSINKGAGSCFPF